MSQPCTTFRVLLASMATLALSSALAEQTSEAVKKPDPTPPPRGTTSFVPPPELEKQPLTPYTFVVRAAVVHMFEIEAGELALQKSKDPAVRTFAEQLVTEHRSANQKLRELALAQHAAMPGTVDEEHRKMQQDLKQVSGAEFDALYLQHVNHTHKEAQALFQSAKQAQALPEPMREYADDVLASVQQHQQSAQGLSQAVKP